MLGLLTMRGVPADAWNSAKEKLRRLYAASTCLETVLNMLSQFEMLTSGALYLSN